MAPASKGTTKPLPPIEGRRPLIAGNWKMNYNHLEAIGLLQKLIFSLDEEQTHRVEVAVLPPFVDLRSVQTVIDGDQVPIAFGAQDLSPHDSGAYTGDVSGPMLAKLGCRFVVVGHSERREYHAEGDDVVNTKVVAAYRNGVTPILCVGETLDVREAGGHIEHTTAQLTAALRGVTAEQAETLVVAYEPVWAIGTGKVATPDDAQEVCAALRATLAQLYSTELAGTVRILYGGSVKAANAAEIVGRPDVDGALVGGASLDAEEFAKICIAAGTPAGAAATGVG
ncbi:triosephosphate isomerase [Jatrophihabitans endophyticus]|uniref:Triosephosphate isomerase n=1 Tax=Jatrophihabitans endophyticus TaxID=1206085 RepID=A0A1M5MYW5_9ACTN|nr:triose-phosphate isomerase [Jatrophihabitans endophyticus]SHG82526.1 triosephosphate isomerase [Jatrophihabitans endophyticus]